MTSRTELRVVEAEFHDAAGQAAIHARHADLTIIGRPENAADPRRELIETILFGAGRPLLIVPRGMNYEFNPRRVLVAWNATREAARALADAGPFLCNAQSVRVITINAAPLEHGEGPGFDIGAHLACRGVDAEITNVLTKNRPAGEVLLAEAAQYGADLVVLGGYGHSRLQETIFGGVTKWVLIHADVPMLMSH